MSVLLPAPFAPTRPTIPGSIATLSESSAVTPGIALGQVGVTMSAMRPSAYPMASPTAGSAAVGARGARLPTRSAHLHRDGDRERRCLLERERELDRGADRGCCLRSR